MVVWFAVRARTSEDEVRLKAEFEERARAARVTDAVHRPYRGRATFEHYYAGQNLYLVHAGGELEFPKRAKRVTLITVDGATVPQGWPGTKLEEVNSIEGFVNYLKAADDQLRERLREGGFF